MSNSNLGGLITAYSAVCRTSDLTNASTRTNVQRAILPMLRKYRAELLRGVSEDRNSTRREYLSQVMAWVREVRRVIIETLQRLRDVQGTAA